MKTKAFRHGDLVLMPIKALPEGLEKTNTNVLMTGSGGNDHTAKNCDVYFKKEDDFVFGYLIAKKGAALYHREHGEKRVGGLMEVILPQGIYQLRRQVEFTHGSMRPVVD